MKKDVLISIRGVFSAPPEDNDVVEIFTTGTYYKKDGAYYIAYDESEATGFEGSKTVLKVEKESMVTLERSGSALAHLVVEQGVRHQCNYDIGYGDMMIGISGNFIKSTLGDNGGDLQFKYSLDINTLLASENEMFIKVTEDTKPS